MRWFDADPGRWRQEQVIATRLLENCKAGIDRQGRAYLRGVLGLYSEHAHRYDSVQLLIVYPDAFPESNEPPDIYLESHRDIWINLGDSHIEEDWRLCLFVPFEAGINFADESSLQEYIAVVHTFLLKQRIYQKRMAKTALTGGVARWPGEDRSHGLKGIKEAIDDLGRLGRNPPCPCGSGKKFKKCHMREIRDHFLPR